MIIGKRIKNVIHGQNLLMADGFRKISRPRVMTIGSGRDIPMIAIVDDDEAVRMATERLSGALGLIVAVLCDPKASFRVASVEFGLRHSPPT